MSSGLPCPFSCPPHRSGAVCCARTPGMGAALCLLTCIGSLSLDSIELRHTVIISAQHVFLHSCDYFPKVQELQMMSRMQFLAGT